MAEDFPVGGGGGMSRRERQIMDIIYARGEATAMQVFEDLPDASTYSAVRGLIHVMERKGYLRHRREGVRNVYLPRRRHHTAGREAMKRALDVFYGGDLPEAVAALLKASGEKLSAEQIDRVTRLIEQTRRQEG